MIKSVVVGSLLVLALGSQTALAGGLNPGTFNPLGNATFDVKSAKARTGVTGDATIVRDVKDKNNN